MNNNNKAFKSAQYNYDNQIPEEKTIICYRCSEEFNEDDIVNLEMKSHYFGASSYVYNICEKCMDEIMAFANKRITRD